VGGDGQVDGVLQESVVEWFLSRHKSGKGHAD
jgi:hypothetical protein